MRTMSVNGATYGLVQPQYPRQKLQEAENHRAIAAFLELVADAISTAENYIMYTDGRLKPLAARGSDLIAASQELKERYRHEAPCGWTEAKLLEHCEQALTAKDFEDILSRHPLDTAGVRTILHTLQDSMVEIPRGRFLLMRENLSVLKPHQPPDLQRDIADICGALYEIQHVNLMEVLLQELSEFDGERDRALQKVEEATVAHERAKAGGDVVEVERTHRQLIAARYELVSVYAKRMQHILGEDVEAQESSFAAEMDALEKDAREACGKFSDAVNNGRDAVRADLRNCDKKRLEEDAKHRECLDAYRVKEKEMDANLKNVVENKRKLVEELRQKAQELRELMAHQEKLVDEQVQAKRAEEERVTAYNEFVNMEEQQKHRLLRCLDYFDSVSEVLPDLKSYVDGMIARLPRQGLRIAMNQLNDSEAGAFMEEYRKFVACCGDLTVKKMHRLDTLERQARLMEHNRNSSMESLDPNMNNYRVELDNLIEQMKGVSGVINALIATQDAGEGLFQSIEKGVLAKHEREGVPFVHPLQEYGLRSVEERNRFVDRSMRYVEDEERKVLEKKNVLNRMRQAVKEDEAAAETVLRSLPAAPEI